MATIYFALNRSTFKAVDMQGWSLSQIQDELPAIHSKDQLMPALKKVIIEQEPGFVFDDRGMRFLNRMTNQLSGIGLPIEIISENEPPHLYEQFDIAYGIYDSGWVGHQLSRHLGV